jgi:hypothetical protein
MSGLPITSGRAAWRSHAPPFLPQWPAASKLTNVIVVELSEDIQVYAGA